MAEKIKDAEDRLLESMFASEPIADDGFSDRIIHRIRRRIWVRRLALPIAMVIGTAIAIKPVLQLIALGSNLLGVVAPELLVVPEVAIPQLSTIMLGGTLLAIVMLSTRMLEE